LGVFGEAEDVEKYAENSVIEDRKEGNSSQSEDRQTALLVKC